uniref:Uncharacterized protein n=1 Tax=Phenylobacterium glaciei TaxID=2803784 RepID=A0A974S8G5_9CAUL|nr:hypothetical protein JKL49_23550 [Phenylobacterium glaciei]
MTVVADAHGTWDYGGETAPQIIARHNAAFAQAGARVVTTADLTGADPSPLTPAQAGIQVKPTKRSE